MSITPDSTVPIFQQIADRVRRDVAAGIFQPGEMIPSVRVTSLQLTVNPNTVQRAYELLEREGVIQSRKGLGMFVTKAGVASACQTTRASVRAAFTEGIRTGLSAHMPPGRIRETFDRAWRDAGVPDRDRREKVQ